MDEIYLVTGATGFLGHTVVKALLAEGKRVVGLRMPQDRQELLSGAEYEAGDITKPYTLTDFFAHVKDRHGKLIHCAGMVSVASGKEEQLRIVNVEGTKHMVDLSIRHKIDRFIYVSSVHAIKEEQKGIIINEATVLSAGMVEGDYGKSKAEATAYVLKAAERGLNTAVVYPSGIIGPEDDSGSYMTEMIRAFLKGRFPIAVEGGFDFVDVRDVAEGIITCADRGKSGETYILSNEYMTVKKMFDILSRLKGRKRFYKVIPLKILIPVASMIEKVEKRTGRPLFITPYSLYTLGSNGSFSHEKADRDLGYAPRPLEDTLKDTVRWMQTEGKSNRRKK